MCPMKLGKTNHINDMLSQVGLDKPDRSDALEELCLPSFVPLRLCCLLRSRHSEFALLQYQCTRMSIGFMS